MTDDMRPRVRPKRPTLAALRRGITQEVADRWKQIDPQGGRAKREQTFNLEQGSRFNREQARANGVCDVHKERN